MWNLLIYTKKSSHKNIYKYFKNKLEIEDFINKNKGISIVAKCYNVED